MSQNNLYTLSLDSIKYILGLIRNTVDLPTTILDDLNIATNTTYSSYRLDTLLKALKEENIKYCDEAIAGLNKLSKEIVDDSSKVVKENTIYLILTNPVNNVYEQWLLINGTPQMIGTTEMNLDSVYTKDEADARYTLITDFNSLKTKVDGKVDKTSIITTQNSSATDDQVYSAKVINTELDGVVKKVDISTTIDSTSTNDTVPSTKAVFDNCIQGKIIDQSVIDTYGTEILKYPLGRWVIAQNTIVEKFTDLPIKVSGHIDITSIKYNNDSNPWSTPYSYRVYSYVPYDGGSYVRKLESGSTAGVSNDTGWQKVCTTSVADVPVTNIPYTDATDFPGIAYGGCKYYVRNGICYVSLWGISSTMVENDIVIPGAVLPKTANGSIGTFLTSASSAKPTIFAYVQPTGQLALNVGEANILCYGSFSYPVAES